MPSVVILSLVMSSCRYVEHRHADCRYAEFRYAECLYAEYRYAECRVAVINLVSPNSKDYAYNCAKKFTSLAQAKTLLSLTMINESTRCRPGVIKPHHL